MVAPVAGVDILDHLVAPFVLEIDVDIRRLVTLGGDEAFEQQIETRGVDFRYAEAETHGRIGRRAPPLTEDAARAGEAHDVVNGEEIGGVVQPTDQFEFVAERLRDTFGDAIGKARLGALMGERLQRRLRRGEAFAHFLRVGMGEFVETELYP